MIRWKVVTQDRYSCSAIGGGVGTGVSTSRTRRKMGKYLRKYTVGKTVTAEEGTIGLCLFERKKDAIKFMKYWRSSLLHYRLLHCLLIKVEAHGKGKRPERMAITWRFCSISDSIQLFTLLLNNKFVDYVAVTASPPEGTICYQACTVLT